MEMVKVNQQDWRDEFTEMDRRIFQLVSSVFPKGLTAEEIAGRMNTYHRGLSDEEDEDWPVLSASDVGDFFYGDKDNVSDELAPYVVPVPGVLKPRRWRIRATSDP